MVVYLGSAGVEKLEAVVLAAGRGQRMKGISKPFFKPLLEINGIPLIAYAVDYALTAGATRVVVVVSPKNKDAMAETLARYGDLVSVAVQPKPLGPGHATLIGLYSVTDDTTMLLMSDNLMDADKVKEMTVECTTSGSSGIGIRVVSLEQASRFTRVRSNDSDAYAYVEGTQVTHEDIWPGTDKAHVWCGPLIFQTASARSALENALNSGSGKNEELKIGPYLSQILGPQVVVADVNAMDVGIPSAYLEKILGE